MWGRSERRRVVRGGSWNNNERNVRAANRDRNDPDNRNNNVGFRCVSQNSTCSLHRWGVAIPGLDAGRSRMSGPPQGLALRSKGPRSTGADRDPGWGQPQANTEEPRPLE
ncbi:MAG: SUMF1/EgtB/PvdO family nonheme iron enzyme [Anaerolineae bacterium]|nr:SUMF1/EgtB/PvdO family nonheme iron enzyme [Anaerolineae bacterium]